MRTLIILVFILTSSLSVFGMAPPHTLSEQFKRSDTILRVVVVSYTEIKSPNGFSFLVKCKIITKYKGGEKLQDYIYIPSGWNMDPDPSPLDAEGEYVVFLETLKSVSLGHPVTYDATHDIKEGKVGGVSLQEFEKRIEKLKLESKKAAEQVEASDS